VWLQNTFAAAREQGARAVMLVIQANPGFDLAPADAWLRELATSK